MTVADKISEIERVYNYWISNYKRQEKVNNNARITAESIAKAIILNKKGERQGTNIILGRDTIPVDNRESRPNTKLSFAELIQSLKEIRVFTGSDKAKEHFFELIRDATNKGSHSVNRLSDIVTADDMEVCKINLEQLVKWLFDKILQQPLPQTISNNFAGEVNEELYDDAEDKFLNFEVACQNFDERRYQYILLSPPSLSQNPTVVETFTRLPWRLVIDFNAKSDEEKNGLLYNFNKYVGSGYKKTFTKQDKIEFDPNFRHYWFMADGQGNTGVTSDFIQWKNNNRNFYSNILYQEFIKGSRIKPRIVVLLNIDPKYAQFIISEFNRIDYSKLHFILCSETELYENVFDTEDNVELINISPEDIANGIINSENYKGSEDSGQKYLIPHFEDKKTFVEITQDHFDYLASLGIEVIYKDIDNAVSSDNDHSFYKGNVISWRDLSEQKDVSRNALDAIQKRLLQKLNENKLDEIQLIHEAGAGGTTLARRIAFNFSTSVPTVILKHYHHRKTIDALRIIYDQYTKGSLPLLIVAESYEIKDTHLLYRDLSSAKKNALIFLINRGSIAGARNKKFTLKSQLEGNEAKAFQNMFSLLAPDRNDKISEIQSEYKNKPQYITPILYGLTAFGKDFTGLEAYVLKAIEGLNFEQKKFMGFISIIYYYTQKSVAAELFSPLFNVPISECDLVKILGADNPLLELLHEEGDDDQYYNTWRPRYALVGEEAMQIILSGGVQYKKNWRSNLAAWLTDLIEIVRLNLEYLDDETESIFNALFIERFTFDDDNQDKEFTKALLDLTDAQSGITIFETLTKAYPDESHFHGHFSRYLYSDKIGIKQYDRAILEAEESLKTYANNSSLIHTLGMCYKEKAENLIYTFEQQGIPKDEAEEQVKQLTEQASEAFDRCIDAESTNLYGYESQIRVILKALEFGARIHHATSKESFITNPQYSWYAEMLDKVSALLEEALFVIEQSIRLENRERIRKSAGYIYDCEGLFFKTLGRHLQAKSKFETLIKATPKGYDYMRPHYRRMFVICLLASKTNLSKDLYQAWKLISDSELQQSIQYLEANIFEDPNNTQNIRLWLQAVRHSNTPPPLNSCLAKISLWTQITVQNSNAILEGYYYLYVLTAVSALSDGNNIFDPTTVQSVKDIRAKMLPFIKNEKFCYEWFGKGEGIRRLVNHKQLGEFTLDFFERNKDTLAEVTGRIKEINSSQKGTIILDCGLEAFFVPNVGGFTERNANDRIRCYVGFRYDQIQAWSVILLTDKRGALDFKNASDIQELIEPREIEEEPKDLEIKEESGSKLETFFHNKIELPKPIIIGQIDVVSNNRKKNVKEKVKCSDPIVDKYYEGKIKILKSSVAFIQVAELDKDIAFNSSHLKNCTLGQMKIGSEVKVKLNFANGIAKLDNSKRNYIASEVIMIKIG